MSNAMDSKAAPPARRASFLRFGPAGFAAGAVAAAFGAASCCAIPMLLGALGLGTLGLGTLTILAPVFAPYQSYLAAAAIGCLVAGGALLWRRRACACGATRLTTAVTVIGLTLGTALLVLGFASG